jgi:hypothetical protein
VIPSYRQVAGFTWLAGKPVQLLETIQSHPAVPVVSTPQHLAEKILTARSALEGERKQVGASQR